MTRGGSGGGDPLRRAASRRPDATAADAPGERWSYRRLDREADRLARRLAGRLAGGSRDSASPGRPTVAAFLPRRPPSLAAVHGVPRSGAVLAPLPRGWTERELASYVERVQPDLLLAPAEPGERAGAAVPNVPRLPLRSGAGADRGPEAPEEARASAGPPGAGTEPGRDHSLVATSGSTGSPRSVRLTWRNHLASAAGARERLDLRPRDRWHASLSLAHVGGVALAVRAAAVGSAVVLHGGFDAGVLSRLIDDGEVSHASLVPVMLRRLLDARGDRPPPDSFRCALVGGAGTPPELLDRALSAGLPVALTYGLSEACSQVATARPDLVRDRPGTVGPPLPGVEVRTGEEGEILVRGPTVSPGYLDGGSAVTDGWLRTGDAGRLDDEGHLWVTGRLSESIVTGGTTVHPSEVEEALREHPGVRDAAVVGIPSEEWGEVVGAAVVPADAGPGPDDLDRWARERLSAPRRPRRWILREELPRTGSGKADREAMRELLRAPEGTTGEGAGSAGPD